MGVRVRAMTRARTSDVAAITDADEHDPTVTVRETHDGIDQVSIADGSFAFRQKLCCELFAAGDETTKVGIREHGWASYPAARHGQAEG
jgi:hypothetical protein